MSVLSETWEAMMDAYPRDGWNGAAELIARHDARVANIEQRLDARDPDWHDRLIDPPPRRTAAP